MYGVWYNAGMTIKRIPVILAVVLAVYFLFFLQKIDFVRADLGRMLKNGEIFWNEKKIIDTNTYSYTEPDKRIINSHWASDAVYEAVRRVSGFEGLTVFHALLQTLALLFFLLAARRPPGNDRLAAFFALLVFPLLISRNYIRPEVFSFIFLGVFLYVCMRYLDGQLRAKNLAWLLPLEIVWANTHFFFWLGPLLVLGFSVQAAFEGKKIESRAFIFLMFGLLAMALINPYGVEGAGLPLLLFKEHGYIPPECLPLFDVMKIMPHPIYAYFLFLWSVLWAAGLWNIVKERMSFRPVLFLLVSLFGLAVFAVVRAIPFFGFLFLPVMAGIGGEFLKENPGPARARFENILLISVVIFLCSGFLLPGGFLFGSLKNFGIGRERGTMASVEFYKNSGLKGPLFNNYGIGGYLEFGLFPRERVFVDNRPEAFSASFFKREYLAALSNESVWRNLNAKYGFNVIYFHLKIPPHPKEAAEFVRRRFSDPAWAVVYVDTDAVILAKRGGVDQTVIKRYEITPDRITLS